MLFRSHSANAADAPASFPIAAVITELKRELQAAQDIPGTGGDLRLAQVAIDFTLTHTTDANGKISIGIPVLSAQVGASGERKAESGSTLHIELVPPKARVTMSATDTKDFGITQAIVSTRNQLQQGVAQEPKLLPEKVKMTFKFAITNTGGPTGQIKFLIFTIGGGATWSEGQASTIELTFSSKP